ncbi:type I restriction enzyme HsdR N-terminal domain-containing protein [Pseudarthrobacter sulfonivorans]|uniref:type I restriction enzyme HsdR N-terminal domain-containing protein n=3 Tax=Pseudarthrobacter TaxID=1742993 RepID=UPI0013DCC9CD|nr:type I restriction enzyme HsdR N-terminal domain-containing protein [Pseudarthrobacter sulfonivorans]
MTDMKYQARLQVLSQWATDAAGQGHLVPRIADLEAISAARTVEAPGVSRDVVEPWLPTIQWLLKQAAFGVVDAHVQLPDELSRPLGAVVDLPAPPVMEVSLVAVDTAEAVTVVAEIKPAPPAAKIPKWESEAHEQVKAAVQRFTKPLHDLLARDANEGDTRLLITDMLCEGLGYDKFRDLTTEYMVKQDFADYGVRIDKQLIAFIEVKRVSQKLSERHLRQVQMYAVNEGVEWMILTNGQVWQAYHLTGGLPVIVNLAFEIDLLGPEPLEEKADKMFFLHREALKRRRIDELWKHRAATSPDALLDIILSDSVLDVIRKEIKRNTGITTTVQTLAAVIRTEIVDPKLRNR